MEILSHPVIATIIFLGILVFVHEAGHFLVGKMSGIAVEIFSIGFGPPLMNFRRGETDYRVSAIPLGGFVKFYGMVPSEETPESVSGREFHRAPLLARLATILAGPLANFILAMIAFTIIGTIGVKHPKAIVGEIMPASPAEKAGLQFMDVFEEVNGSEIKNWRDLQRMIADNPLEPLNTKVRRIDGTVKEITITPDSVKDADLAKQKGRIGISPNFIPPVLTVSANSLAAKAGLLTGDRVKYLSLGDRTRSEIRYYRQVSATIASALQAGQVGSVTFWVAGADAKSNDEGEVPESDLRKVVLNAEGLEEPNARSLLASLGLSDSQLTVWQPGENETALQKGDHILQWNDTPVETIFGLNEINIDNRTSDVTLTVRRNGELTQIKPKLKAVDVQKIEGKVTIHVLQAEFLGQLEQGELIEEKYTNLFSALGFGFRETVSQSQMIAGAVIGLFTGDMPLKALGGPIAIAKVASDSVKLGLLPFLSLLALISINLGLFNLIPIPILDGGQLLLIGAEGIARKPLPESAVEGFQKIGFVMVLALIAMATYNDLGRFWASMMKGFSTLF